MTYYFELTDNDFRGGFDTLYGKILTSVVHDIDAETDFGERIVFTTDTGEQYVLFHAQDCCERVSVESIDGDLYDLVNTPILLAEEVAGETGQGEWGDSYTWTFYKLSTINGSVTIRWYGSSNGYYSERVSFEKLSSK